MSSIQPSSLTDEELVRYAYNMTLTGTLPTSWVMELIKRLETQLDDAK
jgi:hypothetical protein